MSDVIHAPPIFITLDDAILAHEGNIITTIVAILVPRVSIITTTGVILLVLRGHIFTMEDVAPLIFIIIIDATPVLKGIVLIHIERTTVAMPTFITMGGVRTAEPIIITTTSVITALKPPHTITSELVTHAQRTKNSLVVNVKVVHHQGDGWNTTLVFIVIAHPIGGIGITIPATIVQLARSMSLTGFCGVVEGRCVVVGTQVIIIPMGIVVQMVGVTLKEYVANTVWKLSLTIEEGKGVVVGVIIIPTDYVAYLMNITPMGIVAFVA